MSAAVLVFGWPAVIVSATLVVGGIVTNSWRFTLGGAAAAAPFAFYLTLTPRFWWASLAYGAYVSAAYAVHRDRRVIAVLAVLPFAALVVIVALAVSRQGAG